MVFGKSTMESLLFHEISDEKLWSIRKKAQSSNPVVRLIYGIKHKRILCRYNSYFPLSVRIDGMPSFPHGPNGVFISAQAKIGKNCVIFHQVTIGSNTLLDSKGQGAPVIGNDVFIGAGAKIIGNVTIGNNVRIGANCVVVKNVPDNTTVVSASPRYIAKNSTVNNQFLEIHFWEEKVNKYVSKKETESEDINADM